MNLESGRAGFARGNLSPDGDRFRPVYISLCINKAILSAFSDRGWLLDWQGSCLVKA